MKNQGYTISIESISFGVSWVYGYSALLIYNKSSHKSHISSPFSWRTPASACWNSLHKPKHPPARRWYFSNFLVSNIDRWHTAVCSLNIWISYFSKFQPYNRITKTSENEDPFISLLTHTNITTSCPNPNLNLRIITS